MKILIVFLLFNLFYANECTGDTNLDYNINVQDIILITNHILEIEILENNSLDNADINYDGAINILDIIGVIDLIINNIDFCEEINIVNLSENWEIQQDLSYFDFESLDYIIDNQIENLASLNGLIIIHNGKIISEKYYNGSSIFDVYNIWSVTKSYMSTLIGQAIDMQMIPSVNSTLDVLLPNQLNSNLENIDLENLLTMSSGYIDSFSYPDWVNVSTNDLISMPYSNPDFFWYNNSACHINAHILFEQTQMTPNEFADIYLFPHLNINNPFWLNGYNNINDGSASLYLTLRQMVKIGQLFNQNGYASEDNQIISSEWINNATSNLIETGWSYYGANQLDGYGYLWWIPNEGYLAFGYGGQFIAVFPSRNLVIGTHSETFSQWSYQIELLDIIFDDIAPIFE